MSSLQPAPMHSLTVRSRPYLPVLLLGLLGVSGLASVLVGYQTFSPVDFWSALYAFDGSPAHLVLVEYRVPRAVIAPIVGAGLAVAGVVVQSITRNRLGSPDTLGMNAGAALAVVIAHELLGAGSQVMLTAAAALGALVTAGIVYGVVAAARAQSPVQIILVGVTFASLFMALVQIVLAIDEASLDQLFYWLSGAFQGRPLSVAAVGFPVVLAGILLAFMLSPALDQMQLDDASARSTGVPVGLVRALGFLTVAVLAGAAVAMAGPVAFVGLVMPFAARWLGGVRHVRQILMAVLAGAIYALLADVAARFIVYPAEAPVGGLTALIGGVALVLLLARRQA